MRETLKQSEELYNQLYDEVRRFAPGTRFHTVRHIIQQFNTNRRIVDAALDRMEHKGIIDRKARSGIFVRANGKRRKVVHLYPDWPSENCKARMERFRREFVALEEYEFAGLPFDYQQDLLPIVKRCDADVILVDWSARAVRPDEIAELAKLQDRVIVLGLDLRDASLNCVFGDVGYSVLQAIFCFVRHGHRKLAFLQAEPAIGGNLRFQQTIIRYAKLCGCEMISYHCHSFEGNYSPEKAYFALNDILDRTGCRFTGLAVNSGLAAGGALRALAEHQIRVPEDVSVIGIGNPEATRDFQPPLTVIYTADEARQVAMAVEHLFQSPGSGPLAIALRSTLELRESLCDINRRGNHE